MLFFLRASAGGIIRGRFLLRAILLSVLLLVTLGAGISANLFQRTKKEQIAPGVLYYHFANPFSPVNFDVLRISRRERFLRFHSVLGDGLLTGLNPVSEQVKAVSSLARYPVAAINGDFYKAGGMPLGLMVADREIITVPVSRSNSHRSVFVIYTSGQPDVAELSYRGRLVTSNRRRYKISGVNRPGTVAGAILYTHRFGRTTPVGNAAFEVVLGGVTGLGRSGQWQLLADRKYRARVTSVRSGGGAPIPKTGAVLSVSGDSYSTLRSIRKGSRVYFRFRRVPGGADVRAAMGGSPVIVRRGKNLRGPGKGVRHPRTAIGYNRKEIYMVVVDGRRAGWSRGMSLYELGELMLRMNCDEALNLDGGGSSTMWVRGKLRNKVSDGRERPVSNSFVVTSSAPRLRRLQRLVIEPSDLSILSGFTIQLYASGRDRYFNPVSMGRSLEWNCDSRIGTISQNGFFKSAPKRAKGRVRVRSGHLAQHIDVNVYDEPPIFQIYPTKTHLFGGEKVQFIHLTMDHKALPLVGDYSRMLQWSVTPGIGQIDSAGLLQAGNALAKGEVTVRLGSLMRRAIVTVGTIPRLLDDFERVSIWSFSSHPDNKIGGSFSITSGAAYRGRKGGMLKYRFGNRFDVEAVYARTRITLGAPMAVRVWVKGNGSSHHLRMAYRNKYDSRRTVAFSEGTLALPYWHVAVAKIPPDAHFPIKLESIYVLKNSEATSHQSGAILLDDLYGLYPPQ